MTREEKKKKRINRAITRKLKKDRKYHDKIQAARNISGHRIPLYAALHPSSHHWRDSNSPTGYSQVCDYMGICEYPCNGDC